MTGINNNGRKKPNLTTTSRTFQNATQYMQNQKNKTQQLIKEIDIYTKATLKTNQNSTIIGRIKFINAIQNKKIIVLNIHVLPNSKSQNGILMDIIIKASEEKRVAPYLKLDKFFKFERIFPYLNQQFGKMAIHFGETSLIQLLPDLPEQIAKRFDIDWSKQRRGITTNYKNASIINCIIAGYVHIMPKKKKPNLYTFTIRNPEKETIEVNLWGDSQALKNTISKLKLHDIVVLPKVSSAKAFRGRKSLNNNGPIYIQNNFWQRQEIDTDDEQITDLTTAPFKTAKCIIL